MTNPRRFFALALLAGLLTGSLPGAAMSFEANELDVSLMRAVQDGNLVLTERLLKVGADPHAIVKSDGDYNALCIATVPERSRLLSLLLEYGANANHWFSRGGRFYSTPLACAVSNGNTDAFETLLAAGADPQASLCGGCSPDEEMSIFEVAMFSDEHFLAWRLIELGVVGERDVDTLVFDLESNPPVGDARTDPYRVRLIEWLRQNDIPVRPKTGHERRSGSLEQ